MPSKLQPTVKLDVIAYKNLEDAHPHFNPSEVLCTFGIRAVNYLLGVLTFKKLCFTMSDCSLFTLLSLCRLHLSCQPKLELRDSDLFCFCFFNFAFMKWHSLNILISGLFDERL